MSIRLLLPLMLVAPANLAAQQAPSSAADAAGKFSLDIPVDDAVTAPAAEPRPEPAPKPEPAISSPPPPAPVTAPASSATFSLDTPIAALIADPGAKAVLDKNLPGLSSDENLGKFQALSLRKLAPLTGGQLSGALLTQTAYDLAALSAGTPPPRAPKKRSRPLPAGR